MCHTSTQNTDETGSRLYSKWMYCKQIWNLTCCGILEVIESEMTSGETRKKGDTNVADRKR